MTVSKRIKKPASTLSPQHLSILNRAYGAVLSHRSAGRWVTPSTPTDPVKKTPVWFATTEEVRALEKSGHLQKTAEGYRITDEGRIAVAMSKDEVMRSTTFGKRMF